MSDTGPLSNILGAKKAEYSAAQQSEILEKTQWASDFSWRQIQCLARFMHAYEVQPGAVIFREGDQGAYMCIIAHGEVDVAKDMSCPGAAPLARLGPGKTFGEMALIDTQPRSASVIAHSKALLLVMTEQNFAGLAEERPQCAIALLRKIARMITERLRRTSGALSEYLAAGDDA